MPADWHMVELEKGTSVALPKSAVSLDVSEPSSKLPAGEVLRHWQFVDGRVAYVIGEDKMTPEALSRARPDEILGNAARGLVDSLGNGGTIKSQRDLLLNGWPGLEVLAAGRELAAWSRVYMVGPVMYQLLETYSLAKGRPPGTDAFLGSLSVDLMAAGSLKTPGPVFETFTPPGAGCSIGMPGKPKPDSENKTKGAKASFTRYLASYGNRVYIVGYAPLPQEAPPNGVDEFVVGKIVESFEGKVTKATTTYTRDGIDVATAGFSFPEGGIGRVDVLVQRDMIYGIVMLYPPGHEGAPDINQFFNSFKLLPKDAKKS